jgi:hypothetical protein
MLKKIEFSLLLSIVAALSGISPVLAAPQQVNNFRVDPSYKGSICISLNSFSNDSFSVQWGSYTKSGQSPFFKLGGITYIQLQARGNNVPNISFRSSSGASFSQSACPGVATVIKW